MANSRQLYLILLTEASILLGSMGEKALSGHDCCKPQEPYTLECHPSIPWWVKLATSATGGLAQWDAKTRNPSFTFISSKRCPKTHASWACFMTIYQSNWLHILHSSAALGGFGGFWKQRGRKKKKKKHTKTIQDHLHKPSATILTYFKISKSSKDLKKIRPYKNPPSQKLSLWGGVLRFPSVSLGQGSMSSSSLGTEVARSKSPRQTFRPKTHENRPFAPQKKVELMCS